MLLLVLYCLSSLLLVLNSELLSVTGVFLSICYLPGLCLIAYSRIKKTAVFDDLILAFPYSIGISSILVLGLLSLGVTADHIALIIHVITGLGILLLFIYSKIKNLSYPAAVINRQELLFGLFALLLILLISIPFLTGPNRLAISAHAFHHSVLVTQIMNGIFPPENPGLGGTIIGYYWGFHALIAALTIKTNLQPIQIIFILNVISLYFVFCISYSIVKAFDLPEMYRYLMPLAVIGLMRADAGSLFMIKLFSGSLISLKELTASPLEPFDVLSSWISGLSWIDTRLFTLHKLYNVSGMMLAITLCYSYLLIIMNRQFAANTIDMAGITLVISACFINYPPLAIFLLFHVPLWSCYIFLASGGDLKTKTREVLKLLLPYIAAGLIVAPYMLYVMASRDLSSGGQGGLFSLAFYEQSLKNMVVFMLPLPLIIYGFWVALKRFSLSKEFIFLAVGTTLCLALTVFTRWPFNNSYKYNYILVMFFSVYFIIAISSLSAKFAQKWLRHLLFIVGIIFLSLTPIVVESSHIVSSLSADYSYLFSGRHIIFAKDGQDNGAYEWIRENTPRNALVMLTYTETNWPCCGFQNNYQPAAIAERTLYVIRDDDYTVSNPDYAKRILFREKLFENPEDPSVIDYFSGLNRSVYLLVEDNLFVEERFKPLPYKTGKGFILVYQNEKQQVYKVQVTNNK